MKYSMTWQDFMRQPENKLLKEQKGIHACKQRFIQEQNKMQWYDPTLIVEAAQDAGAINQANAAVGSSTQFITGRDTHTSTWTWADTMVSPNEGAWTSSINFGIVANVIKPGIDFAAGHPSTRKKVLFACVTGSVLGDLGALSTSGIDCVVTASTTDIPAIGFTPSGSSGSIIGLWKQAVQNQSATATVGGFTNTFAPTTLCTVDFGSANSSSMVITNAVSGQISDATTTAGTTTGSIAVTTYGDMKYLNGKTEYDINWNELPFSNLPYVTDKSYL